MYYNISDWRPQARRISESENASPLAGRAYAKPAKNLTTPAGGRYGFAVWPGIRLSNSQLACDRVQFPS